MPDEQPGPIARAAFDCTATEAACGSGWIAVTPETMPKSNVPVLAFYRNALGNGRIVRAQWAARFTLPQDQDTDWYEYKDEDDADGGTPFCPEGWYETNEYEDVHWRITDGVTHWQALPSPPVQS